MKGSQLGFKSFNHEEFRTYGDFFFFPLWGKLKSLAVVKCGVVAMWTPSSGGCRGVLEGSPTPRLAHMRSFPRSHCPLQAWLRSMAPSGLPRTRRAWRPIPQRQLGCCTASQRSAWATLSACAALRGGCPPLFRPGTQSVLSGRRDEFRFFRQTRTIA